MTEQAPDAPVSAYEKERSDGGEVDPRCVPQALDGDPPVGDEIATPDYTDQDHANWRFLFERQMEMLPGRAGAAYLRGVDTLGMTPEKIPALADLSATLERTTGWTVARIPGLLHERDFFTLLSNRVFPSTDYIRGEDELDYTPAPDLFHDIFGHMPMLTEPDFADFYQLFGQAALNAEGVDRQSLERLHWFTVEFGLIRDPEEIRIFRGRRELVEGRGAPRARSGRAAAVLGRGRDRPGLRGVAPPAGPVRGRVVRPARDRVPVSGPSAGASSRPVPEPAAGGGRQRLEATVSGRVQGVGFRAYVRGWARKLALTGWVRNEPDGTVRVVAEGDGAALDRLARLLWGGPPGARVEGVEARRAEAEGAFEAFTVDRG